MENLVQLLAAWRIVCHDARPSISLSIYLSLCKYIYISKRILDKENFLFFFYISDSKKRAMFKASLA